MAPILSVADLIKQHAQTRGQQTAFSGPGGRSVTYADLSMRTAQLAGNLVCAGVQRGHRVALVLGSCIEAVESTFAITRAAAVGVPLDARSSQAELTRALRNSRARTVVTDDRRLERVCESIAAARDNTKTRVLVIVVGEPREATVNVEGLVIQRYEDWAGQACDSAATPDAPIDGLGLEEPAWLHYTTGTTGQPKGVVSSQRAWMWTAVNSYVPSLRMTSADRLFWPLPLFHAFGHSLGIIGTLAVGASTHLVGSEPLLHSLLLHPETTIVAGAPATYREIVTNDASRNEISLLQPRACVSAGAPAPAGLSAQVEALLGVPILNHYGCTECGMIATASPGDAYREDSCGSPPQGVDVQVRLVSPDGQVSFEAADDEEGEICVRTPSFMLRYDDDELQLSRTEDGWYRTGDLGRLTHEGGRAQALLTVTGRLKELIIRGGENIHPGEVERALRTCLAVKDVVVTGLPHDMLGEVPAAFIVPEPGVDINVTTLLVACRAVLPEYKVPVTFYTIDAIPHTASGKPKRLATVDLLRTGSTHCRPLAARLLTEDLVEPLVLAECAAVCTGGLELEQMNPEQSFMTLGLNSLTSVVLRDRLASLTGLELPVTFVFDHPNPAAVSQYLRERLFGTHQRNYHDHHQDDLAGPQTAEENDGMEPIAIISMDCRYPGGVSSPEDLWRVVSEELDVTSDFPTNREWDIDALYDPDPNKTGTCIARRGGFLHDMADFDAGFFGMSPREALATDPQQRLLLETTHTLIERAGIAPSSLRGTSTGVFIGMIYSDYASRFNHGSGKGHDSEAHLDIGSSPSVAAGRISYSFDLKGPSMAIDAACSSSLTAIHLAAASLQTRESRLAIAGGVTLMSTPRQFIAFSRQRGLSTDGRCRSYSSDANGTGWSEGVGLVLLERLSDARRNGHTILGLVRGSAVNSDGTSNGLTAPSGPAQQEVIRQALSRAALSPADVDVLDGHGTATLLGDPIEVHAILKAYSDRSTPLLLGSVKSNIGHTQAAAGIASVIKMVQSMQHGIAPASLHIAKPSPHIDWTSGAGTVELLSKARPWPRTPTGRPRRAAVSSFGISGTNAHVILEHFEDKHVRGQELPAVVKSLNNFPWLLSGADEAALQAQARTMAGLCHSKDALDIAFSLATTRSALSHRAAVIATRDELPEALLALAEGRPHVDVFTGLAQAGRTARSRTQTSRLAFLFSGQGSQRPGMGRKLCARFPRFDTAFRQVCHEFDARLERPLLDVINLCSEKTRADGVDLRLLNRADFAQAAVFAFEVAMYRLLESFGIRPDYVAGHSLGEISAAHAAGFLSLADAATLVVARGTLMAALPEGGAMASISATEDEVNEVLRAMDDAHAATTVVAAVNATASVVVSGPTSVVLAVKDLFTAQGRPATRLRVSHAFHSPMMEPVLDALGQAIRHLSPPTSTASPLIPLVSTVTGELVKASDMTAEYWLRHVTAPVHFAHALHTLSASAGVATFVEIGPSAPLANYVPDAIATSGSKQDEVDILLKAVGQLWVRGIQPSTSGRGGQAQAWTAVFGDSGARLVDLPVYPFQRRRYWLASPAPAAAPGLVAPAGSAEHPVPLTLASAMPSTPPNETLTPKHITTTTTTTTKTTMTTTHLVSTAARNETDPDPDPYPMWHHQLEPEQRRAALRRLVQDEVAGVLGFPDRGAVPASAWDAPLTDIGFDSVLGILLRNRLAKQLGVTLPGNLIFNEATGTAQALVDFLLVQVKPGEKATSEVKVSVVMCPS